MQPDPQEPPPIKPEIMFNIDGRRLGSTSTVLRKVIADHKRREAQIPCGSCNACCRSGYEIELTAEESERLPHVISENDGVRILPRREDKSCALLIEGKCSVYAQRPASCREYDCRPMCLAGLTSRKLMDVGYKPFLVYPNTRAEQEITMAIRLAALAALEKEETAGSKGVEVTALVALASWPEHLPKARKMADAINSSPELKAQLQEMADAGYGT